LATVYRLIALAGLFVLPITNVNAAPESVPENAVAAQIVPDWLSAETAAQLDVGIDVFLPEVVPAPFEGEPAVEVHDGYYSLYWLLPGSPPTYLLITGEAGGTIPDYSEYDRNVELEVNAEVQGYPAYHDLTPVYDLIYWQVDNVVYSVESRNLSDTDTLTLANNLALLDTSAGQPVATPEDDSGDHGNVSDEPSLTVSETIDSGEVATIEVSNADGALLTASIGTFSDTGADTYENVSDGSFEWEAPNTVEDLYVQFLLIDPESHDWIATAEATVIGTHTPPTTTLDCPSPVNSGDLVTVTLTGGGTLVINTSNGYFPAESPNTDFAPDADGGATLVGTIPDGTSAELNLQAPDVTFDDAVFVYANDTDGVTNAECEIDIIAAEAPTAAPDNTDNGEGLPSDPPTDNPNDGGDESATEEPVDEVPIVEPTIEQSTDTAGGDQGADDSSDQNQIAAEGDGTGAEGDVIEADVTTSTPEPTKKPKATTTPKRSSTPARTKTPKPTPTPRHLATPQTTSTEPPETAQDGMVAHVIGPEGGQLSHPAGATLIIPPGALADESTVTIMPVADTDLPVSDRVDFVPETGFDISIADPAGQPIETLAKPATLRLTLKPDSWRRGTELYWIDDGDAEKVDGAQLSDSSVSASIGHFSRFVAGVPISGDQSNDKLIFLIAAVVAIVIMGLTFGVFASSRRRRPLSVGPRRLPARNRKS
jgi:hypothetical protein